MGNFSCSFAKRLKHYPAERYEHLLDIPVLLIVVDRGKMGITYPRSLQVYDLRLRYTTSGTVKRTTLEQDLGRVCRYTDATSAGYDLPTALISKACHDTIASTKSRTGKQRGGIKSLPPDYPQKMTVVKSKNFYWCSIKLPECLVWSLYTWKTDWACNHANFSKNFACSPWNFK